MNQKEDDVKTKLAFAMALVVVGMLTGCEEMLHPTAQQALQTFCRVRQSDIFALLLTPEERHAGDVLCGAVGLRLGS
jgi:hypothetical protein